MSPPMSPFQLILYYFTSYIVVYQVSHLKDILSYLVKLRLVNFSCCLNLFIAIHQDNGSRSPMLFTK